LEALTLQSVEVQDFEVLVVDNNSTDGTAELCRSFQARFPHFKYVREQQQGLSYARNRAVKEAAADWVLYLDDDAKAQEDMVEVALRTLSERPDSYFFGGVYLPWYHFGRPVWFKDHYASNKMKYTSNTVLPSGEFVSGGIMAIHKSVFEQVGDFRTDIGMAGGKIAYGEESDLQIRARKAGFRILYVPDLVIYHVVAAYKLDLDWFFKAAFALGRDNLIVRGYSRSTGYLLLTALTTVAQVIVGLVRYTPRLYLQSDYYRENWLIDVFKKPAKRIGLIYTAIKQKREA
jgi:GT2 family glycosyltransferase